jgi:hypothetical protein
MRPMRSATSGHCASVDAQHEFWAQGRDQPGHCPAGSHRHDDVAEAWNLSFELVAAVNVSVRTGHVRTAERDHFDALAGISQLAGDRVDALAEFLV